MLMTTPKLIVLRLYNVCLGRFPFFSRLLRQVLVKKLVKQSAQKPYVASSRFFDVAELER